MRRIIRVLGVEEKPTYKRTHALLDDGGEAVGYGTDFTLGDYVEVFFDEKWGVIKMRKTPKPKH